MAKEEQLTHYDKHHRKVTAMLAIVAILLALLATLYTINPKSLDTAHIFKGFSNNLEDETGIPNEAAMEPAQPEKIDMVIPAETPTTPAVINNAELKKLDDMITKLDENAKSEDVSDLIQ